MNLGLTHLLDAMYEFRGDSAPLAHGFRIPVDGVRKSEFAHFASALPKEGEFADHAKGRCACCAQRRVKYRRMGVESGAGMLKSRHDVFKLLAAGTTKLPSAADFLEHSALVRLVAV